MTRQAGQQKRRLATGDRQGIRLFDRDFSMDDVRACHVAVEVHGPDGYLLQGGSSLSKISRDPLELVAQTFGNAHQYPDGFMLFLGTMFAPTQDRFGPGKGFTHAPGDIVAIHSEKLGTLVNRKRSINHALAPVACARQALLNWQSGRYARAAALRSRRPSWRSAAP